MRSGKRPPLDEERALFEATVAAEGVTTSAGEGTGLSLVDARLAGAGANSFVSMMAVIHPGDPTQVDSRDVTAFNNGTGEVTVASAFKGGQVAAGVPYKIVTFRFVPAEVAAIDAKIGTADDTADLSTLFAKHKRTFLAVHSHILLVVHDTSALDADLDTAARDWLLDIGFMVTVCDPADVAANLEISAFDLIVVSASCVAGDAGNLAALREVEIPVICHSAEIAVSAVLNLGGTAHSHAAQTQIEITDNSPMWLIEQATGDLTVTASATIYAMNTKTANAITLAEEATGTGNHLTIVNLPKGEEDGGVPSYAPFFDRYFVGVADYTNMNATWKAIMELLLMHCVMEKRFTAEVVVVPKRAYQEQIPDTDVSDTATTTEADCILLEKGPLHNRRFCLRNFRIKAQADPTPNTMTVRLYEYFDGALTTVDSFDIDTSNWGTYHSLMDMFGVPGVHSDAIKITCQMDAGTLSVKATYAFAEAKK